MVPSRPEPLLEETEDPETGAPETGAPETGAPRPEPRCSAACASGLGADEL